MKRGVAVCCLVALALIISASCKTKNKSENASSQAVDTSVAQIDTVNSTQKHDTTVIKEGDTLYYNGQRIFYKFKPESLRYGNYKFVWGLPPHKFIWSQMKIYKDDSLIDSVFYFRMYEEKHNKLVPRPPVTLMDLDRDGRKELVIRNYSGSADGSGESFDVFTLKNGKLVGTVGLEGEAPIIRGIKDIDGDGTLEIMMGNDVFVWYDYTCHGCMPIFTSYLHYRNGRFYDVTRRYPFWIKQEYKRYMARFLEWRKSVTDEEIKKAIKGKWDEDIRGYVVGIYVYNKLLGTTKRGVRLIKKYLPQEYNWFLSHRGEIDSMLVHWTESKFEKGKIRRYYP